MDIIKKLEWPAVKVEAGTPEMFKCIQKVMVVIRLTSIIRFTIIFKAKGLFILSHCIRKTTCTFASSYVNDDFFREERHIPNHVTPEMCFFFSHKYISSNVEIKKQTKKKTNKQTKTDKPPKKHVHTISTSFQNWCHSQQLI